MVARDILNLQARDAALPAQEANRTAAAAARGLRGLLRDALRPEHDQVDQAFSALDLGRDDHYLRFLRAQHTGLARIAQSIDPALPAPRSGPALPQMLAALDADLSDMGDSAPPVLPASPVTPLHPLAVDYVIIGSRLGTKVLRQRRATAIMHKAGATNTADQAMRYLCLPNDPALWQEFCAHAQSIPAEGPIADLILHHARRCFGFFAAAIQEQQTRLAYAQAPRECSTTTFVRFSHTYQDD
ncbi:biliverdin-producing heme oxygenase [Rhodobacteraceae bacterium]|nr:biliverdin-producing heme oxygenase [Paracoccaceae bacterium]